MSEGYVNWDNSSPGLSFSLTSGKIEIFLKTLDVLNYPEFFRFLFNPHLDMLAIQVCKIDDEGAKRLPIQKPEIGLAIKNTDLVRLVYLSCGWNTRISYRVPGEFIQEAGLVNFDLNKAFEIHEGRLKRSV